MSRLLILVGFALLLFLVNGPLAGQVRQEVRLPDWFYDPPVIPGYLYAIGISDACCSVSEAYAQADERARAVMSILYQSDVEVFKRDNETNSEVSYEEIIRLKANLIAESSITMVDRFLLGNGVGISLARLDVKDVEIVNDQVLTITFSYRDRLDSTLDRHYLSHELLSIEGTNPLMNLTLEKEYEGVEKISGPCKDYTETVLVQSNADTVRTRNGKIKRTLPDWMYKDEVLSDAVVGRGVGGKFGEKRFAAAFITSIVDALGKISEGLIPTDDFASSTLLSRQTLNRVSLENMFVDGFAQSGYRKLYSKCVSYKGLQKNYSADDKSNLTNGQNASSRDSVISYHIEGELVRFALYNGVWISLDCAGHNGKPRCNAYALLEKVSSLPDTMDLSHGYSPGGWICIQLGGELLIGTDEDRNERGFCRCSDGSIIDAGSLGGEWMKGERK